jgi:bifunctional DNase/RNase
MDTEWVIASIRGILPTPSGAGVFLSAEDKTISIFIDPMVARALTLSLGKENAPRPLTHDLMASVFAGLGVSVTRVLIHHFEEGTYFATLCLEQSNELGRSVVEVDARPSDCLVLAAKLGAAIWVARKVWDDSEAMDLGDLRLNEE